MTGRPGPGFLSHPADTVRIMETKSLPSPHDLERLLAAAGIDFTVVMRCPDPACEVCAPAALPSAA